jgi:hypothetical protein
MLSQALDFTAMSDAPMPEPGEIAIGQNRQEDAENLAAMS